MILPDPKDTRIHELEDMVQKQLVLIEKYRHVTFEALDVLIEVQCKLMQVE